MKCKDCDFYDSGLCVCVDGAYFEISPYSRCVLDDNTETKKPLPWECGNSRKEHGSFICATENIPCAQIKECQWR